MRKSDLVLLAACIMMSAIVLANIEAIPTFQNPLTKAQSDFISTIGPPLQNVVWHRTYGGPHRESSRASQCPNGDWILYGITDNQGLLLRTNSNGEYLWHHAIGTKHAKALVITDDGGFGILVRTYTTYTLPYFESFRLFRTDSEGNHLWNQTYEFDSPDTYTQHYFHSLELCSDGGFVVGGNLEHSGCGGHCQWLLRTDANGVPQWNYTYSPSSGIGWYFSSEMIQCQDEGFVFVGSYNAEFPFLLRMNSTGSLVWNQTYACKATLASSIVECSDGNFACVGYDSDPITDEWDIFLMKTDSTGNLLWNKTFELPGDNGGWQIIETADNGLAFTGFSNSTGLEDGFIMVTDSNGNLEWNSTFGGPQYDTGLSLNELSNGDFMVCGFTESFGSGDRDCWLARVREGYTPPITPPTLLPPIPWFVLPIGIGITIIAVILVVVTWLRKRSSHEK